MGYEMPLVCKEVFIITCVALESSPLTLDEYKEKTGVDLREFIHFSPQDQTIEIKNNVKVFLTQSYEMLDQFSKAETGTSPITKITYPGEGILCLHGAYIVEDGTSKNNIVFDLTTSNIKVYSLIA